ncbi:hypothetical protein GPECTOR_11g151 [Gonium pectorale]|uniref:Nucleotide-diphospho-sugar transferase domain-containing protein n=1 Tax=Gonium pectorale TaxID=33097 RepID=A0A150GPP2_GONPE|nr:hypothetical protein GPECTOR_11g151 [Gonium pectorale]|eukprot:KXZ51702.1 hypothetical protein GPECTOR_11g151 [Gonium pectorale]
MVEAGFAMSKKDYDTGFKYLRRMMGVTAWWRKWFTAGRAIALGYNVMAVDTDVVVLDDWYWRAKQPPLSRYNMLSQSESGFAVNGGFSYIQNASPTGPVAWVFYEAMHRAVRWAEDDSKLMEISDSYRKTRSLEVDDQMLIRDCVYSAASGRPVFSVLLQTFSRDDEAFHAMNTTRHKFEEAIREPLLSRWRFNQTFPVPDQLAANVCEHFREAACPVNSTDGSVTISSATLLMPHSRGEWLPVWGGYPFNSTPGDCTKAYRDAYKELGVPLPPDPEDPSTEAAARATKSELIGLLQVQSFDNGCAGCWAEAGWWDTGRHGWWHRHLLGATQRKVAMGHIWAGLFPGDFQKEMVLMLSGHYNWQVAARVARSKKRAFFANQAFPPSPLPPEAPVVRTVLAFAPGVIHAGMSKQEFVLAAQGLAQVAVAIGAIAAWPAVPCDSDWALTAEARGRVFKPITHSIPWTYLETFFQVQPFGDSLAELQCEWPGFSRAGCIVEDKNSRGVSRGMLAVEFHHLRNSTGAEPRPEAMLKLSMNATAPRPPPSNTVRQRVPYDVLLKANLGDMLARLRHESMPVFWLDRLVEVPDLVGDAAHTYAAWRKRCPALRYLEIPERDRDRW